MRSGPAEDRRSPRTIHRDISQETAQALDGRCHVGATSADKMMARLEIWEKRALTSSSRSSALRELVLVALAHSMTAGSSCAFTPNAAHSSATSLSTSRCSGGLHVMDEFRAALDMSDSAMR
eukprot:scaffold207667_cov29-Tisochrysis_lutea.AAC.3